MRKNKVLALLLIIVMAFALAACNKNGKPDNTEPGASEPVANDRTIVIGKTIRFDDFEITVTELKVVEDLDDKYGLRITYDWKNTGKDDLTPSFCFVFSSYQNNVKLEGAVVSDDVDYDSGLNLIGAGGTVKGAHDAVPIDEINTPLRLELSEMFPLEEIHYTLEIDDLNLYR
jgi:hypothetical protein